MPWLRLALTLMRRSVSSPSLGIALLRVTWRFRARAWYSRPPFLPLPDRAYLEWRMHTAYGDHHATPSADEVERYARWVARNS